MSYCELYVANCAILYKSQDVCSFIILSDEFYNDLLLVINKKMFVIMPSHRISLMLTGNTLPHL